MSDKEIPAQNGAQTPTGIDSASFIADYIEIDKNALLYICDLLGITPLEGQIIKSIIDSIETS
jgi:hypothetical protein